MAIPTLANTVTGTTGSSNQALVTADISGLTLAEGDLLVVFVVIDGNRSGTVGLTQSGFTELYDAVGGTGVTVAAYHKTLVSGDTSWTEIEATWTGNEKAAIYVHRIASGDHNGIDAHAGLSATLDSTPDFPAVTYGTNTLSLAFIGINGNVTMSVNPTGYTTDTSVAPTGGGAVQSWTGNDGLSGAQSANGCTLSGAQDSYAILVGVAEAAGGGSALTQLVSETVNINSGTISTRGITRFISEAVDINEATLRLLGIIKLVAETLNINESYISLRGITRLVAEVININDSSISRRGLLRLVSESVSIIETALSLRGITRFVAEVVSINDSAVKVTGLTKLVAETVNITEAIIQIVSGIVPGAITWAEIVILPKVQFVIDYIGPKVVGKININNGGDSDL